MKECNKVVIVTGGSRGIGKSIAAAFAKKGAQVIIASRKCSEATLDLINSSAGKISFISTNIAKYEEVQIMVKQVISQYGKIDVLINNAGITDDSFIEKMSVLQWKTVIDVNLNGTFFCIKAVIPYMLKKSYGKIINIASVAGEKGAIAQCNYAASKAGVIGLTLSLAQELGSRGINVNAVAPGFIETDMLKTVPEKILEKALTSIPLRRIGKPEEVAEACLYLASNKASYCNGTILDVNGGISI